MNFQAEMLVLSTRGEHEGKEGLILCAINHLHPLIGGVHGGGGGGGK